MIVVFVVGDPAAVPGTGGRSRERRARRRASAPGPRASARAPGGRACRPRSCCPTSSPPYVASWIYVFGVLSLASLARDHRLGDRSSALKGPAWWHVTGIGHFFNSIHLWSGRAVLLLRWSSTCGASTGWPRGAAGARGVWMTRRDHLPGRDPVRVHRLRLAAELRRAVDLHPGQGRAQRGRDRGVLQRHATSGRCTPTTCSCCRSPWSR